MSKITGAREIVKALNTLGGSAGKRVIRGAVGKALRVIAKGIKSEVPPKWKEIKKLIGQRFNKTKGGGSKGQIQALAGVGVGKKAGTAAKKRTRPGVGVGRQNIHWFVLGTKQRRTGTKTIGRGSKSKTVATGGRVRRTGRMPAQLPKLARKGFNKSQSQALAVLTQGLKDGIAREAAKAKK